MRRWRGWYAGCLDVGDLDAAFTYGQRRLALDLLDEDAHRQLMQLYAWRGDRSAALRQYNDCPRLRDAELALRREQPPTICAPIAADSLSPLPAGTAARPLRGRGWNRCRWVSCGWSRFCAAGPVAAATAEVAEPAAELTSLRKSLLVTLATAGAPRRIPP